MKAKMVSSGWSSINDNRWTLGDAEDAFEKSLNKYIADPEIKVVNVQYQMVGSSYTNGVKFVSYTALVMYELVAKKK